MKKLVTLMLVLSLGGSQVFAANGSSTGKKASKQQSSSKSSAKKTSTTRGTSAPTQATEGLTAGNKVIGGALIALVLYLAAPRGEDSLMGKISQAIRGFLSGQASPAQCASYVVDHFTDQIKTTGADVLSSVGVSVLTDAQRLEIQKIASRRGWSTAKTEKAEQDIAKLVMQEENAKVAPMFEMFEKLFEQQSAKKQSAIDRFLAARQKSKKVSKKSKKTKKSKQAQSTVGH